MGRDQLNNASGLEGLRPIRTHRTTVSRLFPDSRLFIDDNAKDTTSKVERWESSTGQATERPRAELPAERMRREIEPKRRPLKAIARLVGLAGLWNAHKEEVAAYDSPNGQLLYGQCHMRIPMKEQESSLGSVNHRRSSRLEPGSMSTKSDMASIRQKIDARSLSDYVTNEERLQHSKEQVGTSGRVDSKDLLLKYVQKRDALFAFKPNSSLSTFAMKPTNIAKYATNGKASMLDRGTGECNITYPERIDDLLLEPQYRHRALISRERPTIQSWRKKGSYYEAEFAGPTSSGVRRLAREITDRLRNTCDEWEGGICPGLRDIHMSRFGNIEGEKRFEEGWKITHQNQDLERVGEVITLGELLAIPEGESSSQNYADPDCDRSSTQLGIGYPLRRLSLSPRELKSRRNKCLPSSPLNNREIDYAVEARLVNKMEANVSGLYEEQMINKDDYNENPMNAVMIDEQGGTHMSSRSSLLHQNSSSIDNESATTAHNQEDFCIHQQLHHGPPEEVSTSLHHLAELVSSEISNDPDHASPASSTVEVPPVEDASRSPESFERSDAEARMQLQLLKLGSRAYNKISALITTEEDIAYPSSSWESSYILDVLIESGFEHFNFDMFKIMWQYPDYPLDPNLFVNLEEKYAEETTGSRPERLLLFHRINFAIFQIFQDLVDLRHWLMPKSATREKERAKDALKSQKSSLKDIPKRIILREMQWEDHTEEIVLVGNEIEELLMDDLITEFLCKW